MWSTNQIAVKGQQGLDASLMFYWIQRTHGTSNTTFDHVHLTNRRNLAFETFTHGKHRSYQFMPDTFSVTSVFFFSN